MIIARLQVVSALACIIFTTFTIACGDAQDPIEADTAWRGQLAYPAVENLIAGIRLQEHPNQKTSAIAVLSRTPKSWPAGPQLDTCSSNLTLEQSLGELAGLQSDGLAGDFTYLVDTSDGSMIHALPWTKDDTTPRYQGEWTPGTGPVSQHEYSLQKTSTLMPIAAAYPDPLELLTPTHLTEPIDQPLTLNWTPGNGDVIELIAEAESTSDEVEIQRVSCFVRDDGDFDINLSQHGFSLDQAVKITLRRYRTHVRPSADGNTLVVGISEAAHAVKLTHASPQPIAAPSLRNEQPSLDTLARVIDLNDPLKTPRFFVHAITDSLTAQIQRIRSSATVLSTAIDNLEDLVGGTALDVYAKLTAVASSIGGSGTLTARASAIDNALLTTPTGVISTDLATARGLLVASPGATLQADVNTLNTALGGTGTTQSRISTVAASLVTTPSGTLATDVTTLNTLLNGTATGSTTQARIAAVYGAILASPSGVFATDLATARGLFVSSLGATLQADAQALNTLVDGTPTGSTTQARITTERDALRASSASISEARAAINTVIGAAGATTYVKATTLRDSLKASETSGATALTAVNAALGSSGTTYARVLNANGTLDGVQFMSGLTTFTVSTPATNSSGTVTIIGSDGSSGQSYSIEASSISVANGATFVLTNSSSGNTITFINNSGGSLTSASTLATYLASAHPTGAIIKANTNSKATALKRILTTSGGNVSGDIAMAQALMVASPGATIQADLDTLTSAVNGSNTSSGDLATKIADVISKISGAASSIQDGLNSIATLLVSNTNFSSSLASQLTTQSAAVDDSVISLPNDGTYAGVGTAAASDGSGGVNIVINTGLSAAIGTYNLPAGTIAGGIGNGSTFTLTNGGYDIVLANRSGATISTQSQALRYLRSMYATSSQLAVGLSDKLGNGAKRAIGGMANSLRARIAAIDAALLVEPTGVVRTDLTTVSSLLVTSSSGVLETDLRAVNTLLDGTSTGSTTQARIGSPTLNASASNLSSVIGGTESNIASRLGDPVAGSTGLSALIGAAGAVNGNSRWGSISDFQSAADLHAQLSEFLALFEAASLSGGSTITFDLSGPAPTSLGDLLSKAMP